MKDLKQATKVLMAFAQAGFAKTTMSDLATAAGVSRQTLYNRYKTKEAVLTWAASGFSLHARSKACAELNNAHTSVSHSLLSAFSERTGVLVPLMHGSLHGAEILDLGTRLRIQAPADFRADFTKELTLFLQSRGGCKTLNEATDMSFLLLMAAKGLLLNTKTREDFDAGMSRVINTVLREPANLGRLPLFEAHNFP